MVRIISQEEFERMARIRQGIEVLMSKYAEARRRMEGLAKESRGLQKKLKDVPPDSPVSEQTREQMGRLVQRLRKESARLRESARQKLPLDIDENLTPQLESLAGISSEMADELEKMLSDSQLLNERLAEKLEEMNKKLGAGRQQFDETVTLPLEQLAAVFPLIADQSRFVMLALHQQDLAQRLSALKGRDGEDSPALKTRMRDLEEEQRKLREELDTLLGDIEDHLQAVGRGRASVAQREQVCKPARCRRDLVGPAPAQDDRVPSEPGRIDDGSDRVSAGPRVGGVLESLPLDIEAGHGRVAGQISEEDEMPPSCRRRLEDVGSERPRRSDHQVPG